MSKDENAPEKCKTRTLIGWKAWYTNGDSYCSCKYKWEDIPQRHFLGVKRFYKEEDGKISSDMWTGQDIYILSDEHRDKIELPKEVKIGEWMKDEDYHPLFDKARDEEKIIDKMI